MKGKERCRMHGGATGSGAPSGSRNGNYRHGQRTKAAKAIRHECQEVVSVSLELLARLS
ncbi:hypothetical protein [Methylobacterium longum]|uniref:Uncharacterized protein n=1 Tax=Methylobacterium longum TaxID=767694 RepID=A0ABT8AWR1_9HYPH|nr:hypothetical protein [Methylobacterium longum]MDN3574278.1 hypothetical protein [Methylobacterium longum]